MNRGKLYLIGSLRNPNVPIVANAIRPLGFEVFDDWWSASEDADQWWQNHEQMKGHNYLEALYGYHATCVYEFDKKHLDSSDAGVLVMPAGKSGHLEAGYLIGQGKPVYVLFDEEPERFDIMYRLTAGVFFNLNSLLEELDGTNRPFRRRHQQRRFNRPHGRRLDGCQCCSGELC